jgi:hypothetical protein
MKAVLFTAVIFIFSLDGYSQFSYLDNDGEDCSSPMTVSYTYSNYSSGTGGSRRGYKVYRDGEIVMSGSSSWSSLSISSLHFLNDSVGFVTLNDAGNMRVFRTVNYGNNWEALGGKGQSFYKDSYYVNEYGGYLYSGRGSETAYIVRFMNNEQKHIFTIDTINVDEGFYTYYDTIMGNPLCEGQDHIQFNFEENDTLIPVRINFNKIIYESVTELKGAISYKLYPNPTKGKIQIELNKKHKNITLKVTNVLGQKIKEEDFICIKKIELNLGNKKGVYFVTVSAPEYSPTTLKVIKE